MKISRIFGLMLAVIATAAFTSSAWAVNCPPGKRYYCQGSKCSCV